MPLYFHGWRRKLGVATLVAACLFTVGWVRNLETTDGLVLVPGKFSGEVKSQNGIVEVKLHKMFGTKVSFAINGVDVTRFYSYKPYRKQYRAGRDLVYFIDSGSEIEWYYQKKSEFHGFMIASGTLHIWPDHPEYNSKIETNLIAAPYWSIVIPLTLLSAYLLLTKPCKPSQKKFNEPIATEEA